jgi:Bacterial PH domain
VIVVVVLTVVALALPARTARSGYGTSDRVGVVLFGLLLAAGLYRLGRPRVTVDENGVEVVNVIRRRRLEVTEVVRVTLRVGDPWAVLDLDDGTSLAAMGIQGSEGARARRQVDDLRALLRGDPSD